MVLRALLFLLISPYYHFITSPKATFLQLKKPIETSYLRIIEDKFPNILGILYISNPFFLQHNFGMNVKNNTTPGENPGENQNTTSYLQKIADLSPNILFVISLPERKVLFVNKRIKALLGHETDYIYEQGSDIFEAVIHPEDFDRRMENLEKCKELSDEEETGVEVRVRVLNDNWEWFRVTDKVFEREKDGTVSKIIGTAHNIHESKIYKEKLKEEHRKFKNAQAIGNIGSFERKLPGDRVSYSEEFYRILGLDPNQDELSLQEFMSHVHPDDRETYRAAINHTHATGEPLDIINRIIRSDGSIRHVHRRAAIIKDENGAPIRVYGTVQDITERVHAEEERNKFEQLILSTEKVAGTGSYEVDLLTNKIYLSDGLYRLLDEEPGNVEPTLEWLDSRSNKGDAVKVQQIMKIAAATKKPYTYTRRIYRKDGEVRILEAQGNVVTDAEGNAVKLIGLVQDVTERKAAEEQLRRSEERSRNLLNVLQNAPDAYLVLTPDFHIKMASDAFLEATFTKRIDIEGKHVFDIFPDNPAVADATGVKNLRNSLEQVLSTKKPHRMVIQHYDVQRPDGSFEEKHWSPVNTPVINAAGEVDYIIHRVLDVTEVMVKQKALKGLTSKTEMLKNTIEEIQIQSNQLKESRELLQSVFDASPNSIVLYKTIYDENDRVEDFEIVMANSFTLSTTGQDTNIIGKRFSHVFPQSVESGVLDQFRKTAETGIPANYETWYDGEGMSHWFYIRTSKRDDLLIATIEDITERKKAEQELLKLKDQLAKKANESEYRFATLVTASSDTVYKMSADWETMNTLEGKKFLFDTAGANPNWIEDYIPENDRPRVIRAIRESIQDKKMFELEHQVYDIAGNIAWTYSRAIPNLNEDGEIVEWLGFASNITARKKAEERQSFLLKLSDSLRSLSEPEKIMDVAMENLGRHMGVNRAYYSETLADKEVILTRTGYLHKASPLPARVKISDLDARIRKTYLEGHILVLKDLEKELEPNQDREEAINERQIRACIGVPLVKDEKLLAVVGVHQSSPRDWATEEIALVEEVCERTWAAVERARAEIALREAQESLSIALEAAQMGTWVLDMAQSTSKRNFRHDQIFGYDKPQPHWNIEIAKKHVLPEDHQIFDSAFATALKTGKLQLEVRVRWQDGSIHWMEVDGHFYFDENGKPFRGAGVNFEVTERRQAEEALRESEQRFRNLVEASALAVWEADPNGLSVVDSPSWRAFTGQTFEEWVGKGWLDAVHPDDREATGINWKNSVTSMRNFDYEFRLRSAEGAYRWTNTKAIPIRDMEGRVTKWSGMNLDIHDRKLAEEALRKAKEEAEAASRAKEDFVATISHEIRTPLNAVIGLTNLLLYQQPREDQIENLSSLSFSAKNLLALINDILDFSKLEAGKMQVAENEFDLAGLLLSLKQSHEPQALAKGTKLVLKAGKEIPKRIATDQLKLSQILHNLVSNAVKFTPGGQVSLSVDLDRHEEEIIWLDFEVRDTGIGIAADKVDHIFEKFAQAESSTVRHYGGTGLGLSITKLLLDLMGSEIKVESKIGEGSRFYFSLPVKAAGKEEFSEALSETPEEVKDLSHIRLLLVEDVEINRNIVIQFLRNWWQLQPDEAINGREAVEMAKKNKYDLILMDVRMPVMDGYEATRKIRNLSGYLDTPILALTADKNQEAQQARHATQFSDLLTKPFDPGILKQRILQHLYLSGKQLPKAEKNYPPQERVETPKVKKELTEQTTAPSFEISRYKKISGGNKEVLQKLVNNAVRAMETYKEEFTAAAEEEDLDGLSNLVHKNTTSVHYIQANRLARKIEEYRKILKDQAKQQDSQNAKAMVLEEFIKIIEGLKELKLQET